MLIDAKRADADLYSPTTTLHSLPPSSPSPSPIQISTSLLLPRPLPPLPHMESPGLQDENEAERDRQLAAELELLHKERDEILAAALDDDAPLFRDIVKQARKRLKIAADHRDLQLANLRTGFQVDVQQAWNEFERGKRVFRADILAMSIDRRRRLESLRNTTAPKKKKRGRSAIERTPKRPKLEQPFLNSLEKQGMLRVAATPDEVNNDLAIILNGIDSAKTNGPKRPTPDRTTDTTTKSVDKIHSSRGILHYYDITYEKGDRVSVFNHGKPSGPKLSLKFSGTLLAVNAKEILIRTDSGTDHRVYVTYLKNGKFILKPTVGTTNAAG